VTGERRKLQARSWAHARRSHPASAAIAGAQGAATQSTRAKRDSGASFARCSVLTFRFIAQGRSW